MLSKTAEYALRAVACLAGGDGSPASADSLAAKTQVPRRYLHRVLGELADADLVRSRPGPGGGYELTRDSSAITILDVVNAVDPVERIRECPLGLPSHQRLCPLHSALDRVYAEAEAAFRSVTMRELLESTSGIRPLCDDCDLVVPGAGEGSG